MDDISNALNRLSDLLEESLRRSEEEKRERERRKQLTQEGFAESDIEKILSGEYQDVYSAGGIFERMMRTGAPSGKVALSTMGYAQGIRSRRISTAMGLGEMLRMVGSPYAGGEALYDDTGKAIPYSSGDFSRLDDAQRAALKQYGYSNITEEQYVQLPEEAKALIDEYRELSSKQPKGKKAQASRAQRLFELQSELEQAVSLESLFGEGTDMSKAVAEGVPGAEELTSVGALRARAGTLGAAVQGVTRFVGGPAAIAYEAAKTVYKTADMLYAPGRQGRALGYGGSFEGYTVSAGRMLETQLDALGSFALSRGQTAGAREALQRMGAGGPGSERMYDAYYGSMTDVIAGTQLDPDVLAPFYEQFMRQGGTEEEISSLTKMLKDDLPKAAAASRMSLQGMAEMIQRTTEAAAASPYNYRTKTEISQALISAQSAGAPPGFANIAAGQNALVVAQTAARTGTDYFSAMADAGQLQVTAAQGIQNMLGDMTGDEFRMFRKENEVRVMAAAQMYGVSVDDIQKLYDQGINDFQTSAVLNDAFSDSQLGKKETELKGAGKGAGARGLGAMSKIREATSQKILGTDIDLYKSTGADLKSQYSTEIGALEESLRDMGKEDELEKFQSQLESLEGDKAYKTWELLQKTSQSIGKDTAVDEQGKDGLITLSEEAKKYFKLEWSSTAQNPNTPNNNWSSGGSVVGGARGGRSG